MPRRPKKLLDRVGEAIRRKAAGARPGLEHPWRKSRLVTFSLDNDSARYSLKTFGGGRLLPSIPPFHLDSQVIMR